MTLKTLLLGSAAAFAVVGGAQAADLSVAEPVEYVRICDAFGSGFWYIPGTDTCLAVHGFVEFKINLHTVMAVDTTGSHSSHWDFVTSGGLNFTASSMTEYGQLDAFIDIRGNSDNTKANSNSWNTDSMYLRIGPLKAGYFGTAYDIGDGLGIDVYKEGSTVDQLQLGWAMAGFALAVGIEDPRDRGGTSLGLTYSVPDLVAAATMSQGHWSGKLSVGFTQLGAGSFYGVAGAITINLDQIAAGDQVKFGGSFGTAASFGGGGSGANGANNWAAYAAFKHFWSPTLSTAIAYATNATTSWRAGANLVWVPVTGFQAKITGNYVVTAPATAGVWTSTVSLKRSF